jgi:hypothetical protein
MDSIPKVVLVGFGLLLLGCRDTPPTAITVEPVSLEAEEQPTLALSGTTEMVTLSFTGSFIDGAKNSLTSRVSIERSTDGVSVSFPEPPNQPKYRLRPSKRGIKELTHAGRTVLSRSNGVTLHDQAGAVVETPVQDFDDLRAQAGLPPVVRRAQLPGSPGGLSGLAFRGTYISPEQGQEDLRELRSNTSETEPIGQARTKFVRRTHASVEAWIFDSSVGAVVEHTIERPERPLVRVRKKYDQTKGGVFLVRSVTEWVDQTGRVIRRSEKNFKPN